MVRLALAIAERILHREAQMDPLLLSGRGAGRSGATGRVDEVRLRVPAEQQRTVGGNAAADAGFAAASGSGGGRELQHREAVLEAERGNRRSRRARADRRNRARLLRFARSTAARTAGDERIECRGKAGLSGSCWRLIFRGCDSGRPFRWRGRVAQATGQTIESEGPPCSVGECCEIHDAAGSVHPAEVIGFRGTSVLSMTLDAADGIRYGDSVAAHGRRCRASKSARG